MATTAPVYFLSADGLWWEARGYTRLPAPPFTPPVDPPPTTPFLLNDPASLLNSTTKVLV